MRSRWTSTARLANSRRRNDSVWSVKFAELACRSGPTLRRDPAAEAKSLPTTSEWHLVRRTSWNICSVWHTISPISERPRIKNERRRSAVCLLPSAVPSGGDRRSAFQPATSNQQPATSNQQPATSYSYLNASTGSNLDARIAGSIPKITPVIALAPSAATIANGGIDA